MPPSIPGAFSAKINEAEKRLKSLELLRDHKKYVDYARQDISEMRSKSMADQWKSNYDDGFYDFLLADYSLIQFRIDTPNKFSFVNLPCPMINFDDYTSFRDKLNPKPIEEPVFLYDMFLGSLLPKTENNYIRYDYSPDQHTEGRHPASHFHFGTLTTRIGTAKILTPLTFVYFVIRHIYPDAWIKLHNERSPTYQEILNNIRNSLAPIPMDKYKRLDTLEQYLT